MGIKCGFAKDHPGTTHHETSDEVAWCSRQHYAARGGVEQVQLVEARQGVIPFDEATREAEAASTGQPAGVLRRHPRGRYRTPSDGPRPRFLGKEHLATIPVHDDQHTGHYAVRNGEVVELYQVERPTEGDAAGSTFVRPYGERANLRGAERRRVFAAILADPLGAAGLFGQQTGKCGICKRPLRLQESKDRVVIVNGQEVTGVGPKCAKKFGRVTKCGWGLPPASTPSPFRVDRSAGGPGSVQSPALIGGCLR